MSVEIGAARICSVVSWGSNINFLTVNLRTKIFRVIEIEFFRIGGDAGQYGRRGLVWFDRSSARRISHDGVIDIPSTPFMCIKMFSK